MSEGLFFARKQPTTSEAGCCWDDIPAANKNAAMSNVTASKMPPSRTISTRGVRDAYLRYKLIVQWARSRYMDATNGTTVTINGKPTRYALIENAAGMKLLGLSDLYPASTG